MSNSLLLKEVQEDGINVVALFKYKRDDKVGGHKKGDVKEAYVCTMIGSEITLGEQFTDQYDITVDWMNPIEYTPTGYAQNSYIYKITEKSSGNVVFEQKR